MGILSGLPNPPASFAASVTAAPCDSHVITHGKPKNEVPAAATATYSKMTDRIDVICGSRASAHTCFQPLSVIAPQRSTHSPVSSETGRKNSDSLSLQCRSGLAVAVGAIRLTAARTFLSAAGAQNWT